MRTPKPLEADVQKGLLEWLSWHHFQVVTKQVGFAVAAQIISTERVVGVVWRQNTGAMTGSHKGKGWHVAFGLPGLADIDGILADGRRIGIEVKRPGGKLRPDQAAYGNMVQLMGGVWIVADSVAALEAGLREAGVIER